MTEVPPEKAPDLFAEVPPEWLKDNEGWFDLVCILPILVPLFVFLAHLCYYYYRKTWAEANMRRILLETKELLEGPEHLQEFCVNPRFLENLREAIAEKQRLLHYYRQKSDEELQEQNPYQALTDLQQDFVWVGIMVENMFRVASLCLNVNVWSSLSIIIFGFFMCPADTDASVSGFPWEWAATLGKLAFFSYNFVLVESVFAAREGSFLWNVKDMEQTQTVIDRMVGLEPQVRMHAFEYDWTTRTLSLMQTDGTVTNVVRRVPNFTEETSECIPISSWSDLSVGAVLGASKRGVTTLFVESIICAGNLRTLGIIDGRYHQFQEGHERSGAFGNFQLHYEIPDMKKRITTCEKSPPWWMNRKVFVLASFLGLTWIYRLWLKMTTSSCSLVLVKQVFVDDTDTSEA